MTQEACPNGNSGIDFPFGLNYYEKLWRLEPRDIPPSLLRRTAAVVADTVSVAHLARDRKEFAGLVMWAPQGPSSTILAALPATTPDVAALINGTAAVWNELDEGLRGAGHPGAHVVSAAVAVAEAECRTVPDLLLAILRGYQLQADLGHTYKLHDEVHPHGALGAPAAALAAASVLGLDAPCAYQAVSIAANLAPAGSWSSCTAGRTVRNIFAGQGAQTGVRAAYLARSGITAPDDSIDVAFGLVRGRAITNRSTMHESGEGWALGRGYLKRWSACAWSHTVLDVLNEMLRRRAATGACPLVAGEIHHIEVEVPAVVLRLADVHLGGPLAVRFSLPVLVATLIVHGELNAWIDGAAEDPDVFALMAKVRVKEDPKMTAWWPERMPARVRMGLVDGTQLVGSLDNPVGPRDNDEYVEAVRHKIVSLNMSTLLLDQLVGAVGATALSALKGTF